MKRKKHIIKAIIPGSPAEQLELESGDVLRSIDGHKIEDVLDYEYYISSDSFVMLIQKADGEEWELEIESGGEELGIVFEDTFMSEYRSCRNHCMFCFIDQMPSGMRDTLYFKDDDSRLSFLQGNYVTLTNMSDSDLDRIIRFKLSPINISVHTTNPELRNRMLGNRFAGEALKKIDLLYEAQTPMNGQIVLCKGINDGAELERSIKELAEYIPYMESVSVVPVGLSKYREGLFPLESFTKEDARSVLEIITRHQERIYQLHGIHFIHASDEWYLLAEYPLPEEDNYDDYLQLENGVGMLRLLTNEIEKELDFLEGDNDNDELSIATGLLAYPCIKSYLASLNQKFPNRKVHLYPIVNHFFGESITVAGLITGQDLKEQLKGKTLGKRLLLPSVMFRSGEEIFLDDVSRSELQKALQVPVNIVKSSGQDFVQAVLYQEDTASVSYAGYELKENKL